MLTLNNVTKIYGSGETEFTALDHVNLTFPDHGFVSILGPSGCGKSTLLNMIGLLDTPTEGEIYYNKTNISLLKARQKDAFRNKTIGFIFQSYHFVPTLTILDNVIMPLLIGHTNSYIECRKKGIKILEQLGLKQFAHRKINEVSGGQIQRAAIARALINEPDIILGDEPTGALDSKNSLDTLHILKEISKTKLVIMVTHDRRNAEKYSDQIINISDGKVVDIKGEVEIDYNKAYDKVSQKENMPLSAGALGNISTKSFMSKKLKVAITGFANSFGLVALGFVLATTNGFNLFKDKVNRETAANLPISIPAYSYKTQKQDWKTINQDKEYPSNQEIYPYVTAASEVTVTYNHFDQDYMNFLDSLVREDLLSEYILNIGNSYSYNLTTLFPESLNGEDPEYYDFVSTTLSAGGDYTASKFGIPTNIFHVLYGDPRKNYDVISGKLPTKTNELVLVVNEYNSINFSTLSRLGFYNSTDTVDEIKDLTLKSKVKPISFDDVIGKKYKVFPNNDIYEKIEKTQDVSDLFDYVDGVAQGQSQRHLVTYKTKSLNDIYNDKTLGKEMEIVGIIRPKKGTSQVLLAPSLCYTAEFQNEMTESKAQSDIAMDIADNIVMINDSPNNVQDMLDEFGALVESNKRYTDISTTEVNAFANKYFRYYYINDGNYQLSHPSASFRYSNFSTFINQAISYGVDNLVLDETRTVLSTGSTEDIHDYFLKLGGWFSSATPRDRAKAYEHMISIICYSNSFTNIVDIALFPKGLSERTAVLERLDKYNEMQTIESKKVHYVDNSNAFVKDLGELISLVNLILSIFVAIMMVIACAMNILFTYNNVLEKTKDIGIYRALGMRRSDVAMIFVAESASVGFISGIIGVAMTFLLELPVNKLVATTYSDYFKYSNLCITAWWHILLLISIGFILGVISSIVPSLMAAKKDPVQCLKSE